MQRADPGTLVRAHPPQPALPRLSEGPPPEPHARRDGRPNPCVTTVIRKCPGEHVSLPSHPCCPSVRAARRRPTLNLPGRVCAKPWRSHLRSRGTHLGGLPADGPAAWCRLSCDAAACAASASRTTLTSDPLARGSGSSARAAAASCSCDAA